MLSWLFVDSLDARNSASYMRARFALMFNTVRRRLNVGLLITGRIRNRPRDLKIGGESSDQILTVRNLGGAETLCRRSEKAAQILPQSGGGFFCVFVKDVKFAPSGDERDFDGVHCAMMRHVRVP